MLVSRHARIQRRPHWHPRRYPQHVVHIRASRHSRATDLKATELSVFIRPPVLALERPEKTPTPP